MWQDESLVEDVKDEVLQYLEQLYQNHAPQFIYYKTLFHIFERFLADQDASGLLTEKSQLVDTDIWNTLFEFQKDGVKGAINKIRTHNGCIIADSVGLGKTFEALAVIKYFELLNYRVLVLCPKKLRENWTVYQAQNNSELNPFVKDRFSYTVLSHTDLSRDSGFSGDINLEAINWGNYDLVVIDESHNFRNNTGSRRDEEGNIIRKSRYERLLEDTAVFTATEYSLIWRMLDLLGFPGLALYLILGSLLALPASKKLWHRRSGHLPLGLSNTKSAKPATC